MEPQGQSAQGRHCQCGAQRNFSDGTAYKDGYQVVLTTGAFAQLSKGAGHGPDAALG